MNNAIVASLSGDSFNLITKPTYLQQEYNNKKVLVNALINKNLADMLDIKRENNKEYINNYIELFNSVGSLIPIIAPKKLVIPVIEEVEFEDDDSEEIRDMIDKLNIKTQSFTCDHTKKDKLYYAANSQYADLLLSKDYKEYERMCESFVHWIDGIRIADSYDVDGSEYKDKIAPYELKQLAKLTLAINKDINNINAQFKSLQCAKCEKIRKLYDITMKIITRKRSEIKKRKEQANNVIIEDKYQIKDFMIKNYPTVERVPLSDICNDYKETFGLKLTQTDMKTKLEETGLYKVTAVSHKLFATRK